MIQRQIKHEPRTFPLCNMCGSEPRHIEGRGSLSNEDFDVIHPTGTRHQLECRCGARTAWLGTLHLALRQWRESFATSPQLRSNNVRPLLRLHRENH